MKEDDYLDPEVKRQLRRQAKLDRAKVASENSVIQSIMATPAGRSWMAELLERCHIFHASFTGEALTSAFKEGERSIGLQVVAQVMRACPDHYVNMMGEFNGGREQPLDRRDPDDDRNYDSAGDWIGLGDGPDGDDG